MAAEASQSISLKVLVVNEKNRVILAKPNKDFIDVLFNFMTMPLGIIISLTREHPPKEPFSCLNNLYESVENLEEEHLQSVKCTEMLLHPQSSAELYCKNLKLNLVYSNSNEYYVCDNPDCPLSTSKTARYRCGSTMSNVEMKAILVDPKLAPGLAWNKQFILIEEASYPPLSYASSLFNAKRVQFSLGETILAKDSWRDLPCLWGQLLKTLARFFIRSMAAKALQSISLKVRVVNEKNRVVFAEPNKDFVDVLFSFMTMPLGIIISLTREHPPKESFGCLNNLYESVENHEEKHLQSVKCKEMLLHSQSSVELSCRNLKLNLVNSNSNEYYVCDNPECPLSAYKTAHCRCGSTMSNVVRLSNPTSVP
ncbi:uncharacterized protein LOC132295910 [Cornus florida]|uniref:uncharacterized protein LOC132295910 n=1 Tax=Cornus florida TaxID=4283 RepID=UPI0028A174CA|nr:uncharacterized protein LOC132295910 [Cornus florida]